MGSGRDTRGIRQQTNPNPREKYIAPKHWGGKLDTSSGISKLNSTTNLMAVKGILDTTYLQKGGE